MGLLDAFLPNTSPKLPLPLNARYASKPSTAIVTGDISPRLCPPPPKTLSNLDTTGQTIGSSGLLASLLGGGILSGGLRDLIGQFEQNGHAEKPQSWISAGPNKPVAPGELEQVLGPEKIDWLMQQTGMSREDLLAGLSQELPKAVDKLTLEGRVPTDAEAERML